VIALPSWVHPPRAEGWFADEPDHLPKAPRHTELLDGTLVSQAYPQSRWHSRVVHRLTAALEDQAPHEITVEARMTVRLDNHNRPEADIVVAACPFVPDRTWFAPADVMLVIEVVSPETAHRDRIIKPRKYADAGIPHYWLVEQGNHLPVVRVYELDPAAYILHGVENEALERPVPFPLTVDLAALVRDKGPS
jgi:Uma2 family endonuclease